MTTSQLVLCDACGTRMDVEKDGHKWVRCEFDVIKYISGRQISLKRMDFCSVECLVNKVRELYPK
jgi:hypothetical protein